MTAAALVRAEGRLAKVGDRVEMVRVFTQADFDRFAKLSGDDNPIHVDPAFAATTHFGRTVSHGMLLYAVLSALVRRSGLGAARSVGQKLMFPNPTFTGEPMRFSATVVAVEGEALVLAERVERLGDGAVVCEAEARYAPGGAA